MKGMQRIKSGNNHNGVLRYAILRTNKKAPGIIIGGNMDGNSIDELAKEFKAISRLRPNVKCVLHQSLRATDGEQLTHEAWNEFGDRYMQLMGLSQFQYVFILHDDLDEPSGRSQQHIHIIANRISFGKIFNSSHESMKSTTILFQLEDEFNLVRTRSAKQAKEDRDNENLADASSPAHVKTDNSVPDIKSIKLKKSEIEKGIRLKKLPLKAETALSIQKTLQKLIKDFGRPPEIFELIDALSRLDKPIVAVPNLSKTGLFHGLSFLATDDDGVEIAFKGSQLGLSKNDLYKKYGCTGSTNLYQQSSGGGVLQQGSGQSGPEFLLSQTADHLLAGTARTAHILDSKKSREETGFGRAGEKYGQRNQLAGHASQHDARNQSAGNPASKNGTSIGNAGFADCNGQRSEAEINMDYGKPDGKFHPAGSGGLSDYQSQSLNNRLHADALWIAIRLRRYAVIRVYGVRAKSAIRQYDGLTDFAGLFNMSMHVEAGNRTGAGFLTISRVGLAIVRLLLSCILCGLFGWLTGTKKEQLCYQVADFRNKLSQFELKIHDDDLPVDSISDDPCCEVDKPVSNISTKNLVNELLHKPAELHASDMYPMKEILNDETVDKTAKDNIDDLTTGV